MGKNKKTNEVWDRGRTLYFSSLAAVLVLLGVAILLTESAFWRAPREATASLEFESRKLFIQFLLVVALGGLLGLIVQEFQHRRERRRVQQDFEVEATRDLSRRLTEAYLKVRSARRRLRLVTLDEPSTDLEVLMLEVDAARSELYQVKIEAEALAGQFRDETSGRLDTVSRLVGWMGETYLKDLWTGYVDFTEVPEVGREQLEKFRLQRDDGDSSFDEFAKKHTAARKALVATLGVLSGEGQSESDDSSSSNRSSEESDR